MDPSFAMSIPQRPLDLYRDVALDLPCLTSLLHGFALQCLSLFDCLIDANVTPLPLSKSWQTVKKYLFPSFVLHYTITQLSNMDPETPSIDIPKKAVRALKVRLQVVKKHLEPLLSKPINDVFSKLPVDQRYELEVLLSYSLNTLYYSKQASIRRKMATKWADSVV